MKHTINSNELKAAALFAANRKQVRYYLSGVLVQPSTKRLVATDGRRMIVIDDAVSTEETDETLHDFIIHVDDIKAMLKIAPKAAPELVIDYDHYAGYVMTANGARGEHTSTAIDGRYPDYERVIPNGEDTKPLLDNYTMNWHYIADCQTAIDTIACAKRGSIGGPVKVEFNGAGAALLTCKSFPNVRMVVMSMRAE